jgi:hypothetical protein
VPAWLITQRSRVQIPPPLPVSAGQSLIARTAVGPHRSKADEPGIAAFIPIWNLLVLLKIVGRPWWWLILYIIPIVGLIVAIVVLYDLAKSFGHGVGFTIGLEVLSWIFLLILWLGGSRYLGPRGESAGALA